MPVEAPAQAWQQPFPPFPLGAICLGSSFSDRLTTTQPQVTAGYPAPCLSCRFQTPIRLTLLVPQDTTVAGQSQGEG